MTVPMRAVAVMAASNLHASRLPDRWVVEL
jgi:hypothetical protein